jgi:hypothetical protein
MRLFAGSFLFACLMASLGALGCAQPKEGTGSGGATGAGTGAAGTTGSGTGTAGTTGSGTGTAGTGGPACVPDTANLVNDRGWICAKDTPIAIQGAFYGFTDMSSCATPASNICSTGSCCITGTTVVDPMFLKWGCGIGMELNSSGGTPPTKSAYAGPVKCFDITLTGSSGGNSVRIGFTQAADNSNKIAPFVTVAAFTNGWNGRVCFTDAECPDWAVTAGTCTKAVGTAGTPYDLQIQVAAGSTTTTVGMFNVCVSKVAPVIDPGMTGTTNSCSSATGQGTITDRYGTAHVTCSGKDYVVQNNAWGSAAGQTITYGPGTKFKVTQQAGTGSGTNPASYPSVWTGANSGRSTTGSNLPRAVSSINMGSLDTSWTWAQNGATGSFNAAYDVWFSTGASGDPQASSPTGGFLMVWFHDPAANQPIGTMMTSATIAGKNWNVWYGMQGGTNRPCVSYVAQTTINSLNFKLGDFIRDAVTKGFVQNSWYLTNVFAGFEIWSGGIGLETTDFSVTVP